MCLFKLNNSSLPLFLEDERGLAVEYLKEYCALAVEHFSPPAEDPNLGTGRRRIIEKCCFARTLHCLGEFASASPAARIGVVYDHPQLLERSSAAAAAGRIIDIDSSYTILSSLALAPCLSDRILLLIELLRRDLLIVNR